jgi:ABC-type glycerol-3-phosphate transport system substrate-binding protein
MRFLRLWTINDDYATYIKKYMEEHPSDGIVLEITQFDNSEQYKEELQKALKNNALDAPDIFSMEDPDYLRYTQGDMQSYTLPFDSLGITDSQIEKAQFYDYILQMATGTDNKIHGLGYQSTAGAMIYNKAIAEELDRARAFAGSNATTTEEKLYQYIFPGIDPNPFQSFAKLCELGKKLATLDKYLISTYDDIWKVYRAIYEEAEDEDHNHYNRYCRWVDEDNNLVLNPIPNEFYYANVLPENGENLLPCHNADPWSEEWFADMTNNEVFAFFGPAWFIKYFLRDAANVAPDQWGIIQSPVPFTWGGSFIMVNSNLPEVKKGVVKRIIEWMTLDTSTDGLMYKVAAEEDDTVASQVVMNRVISEGKGTSSTLGGADIYTIYDAAAQTVSAEYKTWYDSTLDELFTREIRDSINMGLPRDETM